jgi:Trk K+ transport system NAD-binding subunit
VAYTASTIGFGEIPYALTPGQRLWTTLTIYLSVITWVYAVGSILALLQDASFQKALTDSRFARGVRRLSEPFFLVCGYGETGSTVVASLLAHGDRVVVVDIDPGRIQDLALEEPETFVPGLCADASAPGSLLIAGLRHRDCRGLVACTSDDHANLTVALTAKLLNQSLPVIGRTQSEEVKETMVSCGTDQIVDPFEIFAERLAMAVHSPGLHVLHEWLTGVPHSPLVDPIYPPRGRWLLCAYGRFGKAVHRHLAAEGVPACIIESDRERATAQADTVVGDGTRSATLLEAEVGSAVGLVAGTADDTDNLSIVMAARALNPKLFVVARQNLRGNDSLFRAAACDMVVQPTRIVARKIIGLLLTPLRARFLFLARQQGDAWANELVSRIAGIVAEEAPSTWEVEITAGQAPAVMGSLRERLRVRLAYLSADPRQRDWPLPCIPLLLRRGDELNLLPAQDIELEPRDRILYCGGPGAEGRLRWTLSDPRILTYIATGRVSPDGSVWRWLDRRARRAG